MDAFWTVAMTQRQMPEKARVSKMYLPEWYEDTRDDLEATNDFESPCWQPTVESIYSPPFP
jgi:hypothetical protein